MALGSPEPRRCAHGGLRAGEDAHPGREKNDARFGHWETATWGVLGFCFGVDTGFGSFCFLELIPVVCFGYFFVEPVPHVFVQTACFKIDPSGLPGDLF